MKEQIGAVWGRKLAACGVIALADDPSYQEESGEPRDLEDSAAPVEDVRAAVDSLNTLPVVGEERIGLLRICADGGSAVNAPLTKCRFKAVGIVIAVEIDQARREESLAARAVSDTLKAAGEQRTAKARGGDPRYTPRIPDTSLHSVQKALATSSRQPAQ